jgi:hypothetical protein
VVYPQRLGYRTVAGLWLKAAAKERQGTRTDKLGAKLAPGAKRRPSIAAGERGKEGGRGKKKTLTANGRKGKRAPTALERTAKATGKKARTLAKAEAVVAAAERDPENYGTCERQPPTSPRLGTRVGRPVYPGRVTHILLVPPARP